MAMVCDQQLLDSSYITSTTKESAQLLHSHIHIVAVLQYWPPKCLKYTICNLPLKQGGVKGLMSEGARKKLLDPRSWWTLR